MIVVSKYIVPNGYNGLTIYPFVFLKQKNLKIDKILINHERIHLRQQIELLILPFFIWYILEFLILLVKYKSWKDAYLNISFEKEAYVNEKDLKYLDSRPFWNFLKFL